MALTLVVRLRVNRPYGANRANKRADKNETARGGSHKKRISTVDGKETRQCSRLYKLFFFEKI